MKLLGALVVGIAMLVPALASADETGPVVHTTKIVTIIGRPARPSVVIELTRPTAAREAGAAHEAMRLSLASGK